MKYLKFFLFLIFFLFVGVKIVKADCIQPGDECCFRFGGEKYCENGLVCGTNGICSSQSVSKCGGVGEICCQGRTCNEGSCIDGYCKIVSSNGGAGTVGDAELPDYPDGVGFKFKDATLGTVIGKIIEYIYIFAGFALLIALLMGGFTVLTAAGSPEKAAKGYNQATYGVIGFILIFVSYMVVLLIQAIFHVKIFF